MAVCNDRSADHPGRVHAASASATATLLVAEVNSELASIEATRRKHDEGTRLAPRIDEEQRGWRPVTVTRLLVLPDDRTTRRRVDRARVRDHPVPGASRRDARH